jgi:glycosyltransferase involved in cell wall biosynthesis
VPRKKAGSVLFIDSFRASARGAATASSDSIGYGITAADAICRELAALGYEVLRPLIGPDGRARGDRLDWTAASYVAILEMLRQCRVDLILCFHAFGPFPAEVRRMCLDLGRDIPIIGYTMGSHWDPTDDFRTTHYPGMQVVDLANLHVLDRILLVSHHLRAVLDEHIAQFNPGLGAELAARMTVVGLPIDTDLIDACRPTGAGSPRTRVVFNHAPIASKRPEVFLDVAAELLSEQGDVDVLLTRRFPPCGALDSLVLEFPDRVLQGNDLPIEAYYRWLWGCDIQVSTAIHESLGIATLEAMYTGNYCVAPRIGSYPEILGAHHPGLYDGSRGQLLNCLRLAVANPQTLAAAARGLHSRALRYSPERVTRAIAGVISDLLTGPLG